MLQERTNRAIAATHRRCARRSDDTEEEEKREKREEKARHLIHVSVCAAVEATAAVESPAQLDTAADLTVIPLRLVEELQLDQLSEFPILGSASSMSRNRGEPRT